MSKKQKEDNRDVFEKALDGLNVQTGAIGGLAGGALLGRFAGKAYRNARKRAGRGLRGDEVSVGTGVGALSGQIGGSVAGGMYEDSRKKKDRRK